MLNEMSKKRFDAFWEHEVIDRCVLFLSAPGKSGNQQPQPVSVQQQWMDVDTRVKNAVAQEQTLLGDGFKGAFPYFGPGCLAACIGSDYVLDESTVWFDQNPIIKDFSALPKIEFDPKSEIWQKIMEYTQKACDYGKGKLYTAITDIGGILDVIACLRGTQELLFDLYDYPEEVLALVDRVTDYWETAFNLQWDVISRYQEGCTAWMPLWCRQRYFPLQCDFCAMISPDMFETFVLPNLRRQTEFLDKSVYHLDGAQQIAHLDMILSLPKLTAIQWVPGAGNPNTTSECWYEMYDRIQAAGKGLILGADSGSPSSLEAIERTLKRLKTTRGVFFSGNYANVETAEKVLRIAEDVGAK